ncbi:MAG: hypothetical protein Q8P90_05665 [bacterium]|nr:hypothetical protein [bacterium]
MKQTCAKIISHALDPSLMWPLFVLIILLGTGLSSEQVKILLIPLFVLELLTPVVILAYFHRTGKVSDWEMTDVNERRVYFTLVVIVHVVALLCLYFWGNDIAWKIRAIALVIEVLGTAVTFFWKISVHTAAFTMTVLILNVAFGWQWWPLLLLLPALMWARVVRKKHTVAQAISGSVFTAMVVFGCFYIFSISPFAFSVI